MEFCLVGGIRAEPEPRLQGECPVCGSPTHAKCGRKRIWHWAHANLVHCDPWWENETEWHRRWKSRFPAHWREIIQYDNQTQTKHIADVKTAGGLVVEFQNSPMSFEERDQRESFYRPMVWVINAQKFAANFHILSRLPPPDAELVRDVVFFHAQVDTNHHFFWKPSENPGHETGTMVLVHSVEEIRAEVNRVYSGHHFFAWRRQRDVWMSSHVPVYLDFGDEYVCRLMNYDRRGLRCIHRISKMDFVHGALNDAISLI
jgi:competence protein CoiA